MRFILAVCILLAAAGVGGVSAQMAEGSKAAGLDQCVEETGFMRKYHMEVLLHQRDRTVHEGIRTKNHSLFECVACHAGRDDEGKFISVNATGQFCEGCHTRVAVDIDCFQCHATRPETGARVGESPSLARTFLNSGTQYCLNVE